MGEVRYQGDLGVRWGFGLVLVVGEKEVVRSNGEEKVGLLIGIEGRAYNMCFDVCIVAYCIVMNLT